MWTAEFDRTGGVKIVFGGNAMILPQITPYTRECFLVAPLELTAIKWLVSMLSKPKGTFQDDSLKFYQVLPPNTHSTSSKIGKRKRNPGGRVKYSGAWEDRTRYLICLVCSDAFWTYLVSSVYWCIYLKLNLQILFCYFLKKCAFYAVKTSKRFATRILLQLSVVNQLAHL